MLLENLIKLAIETITDSIKIFMNCLLPKCIFHILSKRHIPLDRVLLTCYQYFIQESRDFERRHPAPQLKPVSTIPKIRSALNFMKKELFEVSTHVEGEVCSFCKSKARFVCSSCVNKLPFIEKSESRNSEREGEHIPGCWFLNFL